MSDRRRAGGAAGTKAFVKLWKASEPLLAAASSPLSADMRLWLLALARMKPNGHTTFDDGEIEALVPKSDGRSYSKQRINQVIRVLAGARMLAPQSNRRCLLVPMDVADYPLTRGRDHCLVHKTNQPWSGQGGGGYHDERLLEQPIVDPYDTPWN